MTAGYWSWAGAAPLRPAQAVLFRTRAQADVLAGALRAAGMPYALHGHADLFSARVVRDVLAYLRYDRVVHPRCPQPASVRPEHLARSRPRSPRGVP